MSNTDIITLRQEQQHRIDLQELRRDELIGVLGTWGPVGVLLIPASLTAVAIATHYPQLLGISFWFAALLGGIAAAGIEVLGLISTETFLQMRSYNQMRSDADEQAPEVAAGIVAGAYLLIVVALVVLLKVWPGLAIYSLLPLTCMGAMVSWIVVLRRQHGRRELGKLDRQRRADRLAQLDNEIAERDSRITELETALNNTLAELCEIRTTNTTSTIGNAQPTVTNASRSHNNIGGNIGEITTNDEANEPDAPGVTLDDLNERRRELVEIRREEIVQLCEAVGPMSAPELCERLRDDRGIEASTQTVRDDCKELVKLGKLTKVGRKWGAAQSIADTLPTPQPVVLNGSAH